jgi:hypothetical protein
MTIDNDQADRHHWEILSPQKILIHKILGQIDELLTIVWVEGRISQIIRAKRLLPLIDVLVWVVRD